MALQMQINKAWKLRFLSGAVVFALACFFTGADCKRSACWRYGHVCWGGHGKRSGPPLESRESDEVRGWNTQSALRKIVTNELVNNNPSARQRFPSQTARILKLSMLPLQPNTYPVPLPYQAIQLLSRQNQRHSDIGIGANNAMEDDRLGVPDFLIPTTDSFETLTADNAHSYSTAIKRAVSEDRSSAGSGTSSSGNGSTEEPLVTSANGLDSRPGAMATFFRDRKSGMKSTNTEKDRYRNGEKEKVLLSPQRVQYSSILKTAQPQYRTNRTPQAGYYY